MSYDRQVDRPDPFMDRLRKVKLDLPVGDEAAFANASADEIKSLFEKASRSDAQKIAEAASEEHAKTWVELHPDWVRCTENYNQMANQLRAHGIENPSVQDFEESYLELRSSNLLRLNQAVLAREDKQAAKDRAEAIKAAGGVFQAFDEAEAYALPLEEVRRRAGGGSF